MRRRVSWCLEVGCQHLYFDVRKAAVERAREEQWQGHPVAMTRCEFSGGVYSEQPVDVDVLLAEVEQREQEQEARRQEVQASSLPPLPEIVWQEILGPFAF